MTSALPNGKVNRENWWKEVTPQHWNVLIASFLGWVFDGYETYALIVVIGPALLSLLPASEHAHLAVYAGWAIGLTLLGWGIGGVIGGVAADYIGRKRMMMISILGYAVFTGLTALSTSFAMLIAFRILTGLFMGSEWSTGNSLLAETWPVRARPKGAGFLQSGFGFGALLASLVWYLILPLGPNAWRWVFVVGIVPAFFILYIRSGIEESEVWINKIKEHRWVVTEASEPTGTGGRRPFTLFHIFSDRVGRNRIILAFLMSISTTFGWWGIATWIPHYVGAVAGHVGFNGAYWAASAGIIYTVGAIIGYLVSGFLADWFGRRLYLIFLFAGGLLLTPAVYAWTHSLPALLTAVLFNGFFTLGGFSWYAIYLPELFGTHVRATSSAFVFNASRLIAWLGPVFAGVLIVALGGVSKVAIYFSLIYVLGLIIAPFMPETRGHNLPE
jgi:MFS family permease